MYDSNLNDEFKDSYLDSTIMSNLDKDMEEFLDTENLNKMFNNDKENIYFLENTLINNKEFLNDNQIENETKSIINSYLINEQESKRINEKNKNSS